MEVAESDFAALLVSERIAARAGSGPVICKQMGCYNRLTITDVRYTCRACVLEGK